jgi:hypothetical protein
MSTLSFFENPDEAPVPREQVAIEQVAFEPLPDGRRIRVSITLTPFVDRPNLDILLLTPDRRQVSSLSVVEALERQMEFTLHIREPQTLPQYIGRVELYFEEGRVQDSYEAPIIMRPQSGQGATF